MVAASSDRSRLALFLLLAVGLYTLAAVLGAAGRYPGPPGVVAAAFTFDLTLTLPLAWWWLLVRPRRQRAFTLVPVFVLCVAIASLVMPGSEQTYLAWLGYAAAPLEVVLLVVVVKRARRALRSIQGSSKDLIDAMRDALGELGLTGRVREIAVTELACLALAFGACFRAARRPSTERGEFTMHRRSGYVAILCSFGLIVMIETVALHFLIGRWSTAWAWVATVSSVYCLVYLAAMIQAVRRMPTTIANGELFVRAGLKWRIRIPLDAIERIDPGGALPKSKDVIDVTLFAAPQLVLVLKQPVIAEGMWGRRAEASRIALAVDDEAAFRTALTARNY